MRTRKSPEARKAQILTITCELLTDLGFKKVSMQLVAKHCGISKAALYVYFPSKEALFADVVTTILQYRLAQIQAAAADQKTLASKLKSMLCAAFTLSAYKPESMQSLMDASQSYAGEVFAEHIDEFKQLIANNLQEAVINQAIALPDTFSDTSDAASFLLNAAMGVIAGLDMQSSVPVQEQTQRLIDQLIDSLLVGWLPSN